jgi:hypothetical protein
MYERNAFVLERIGLLAVNWDGRDAHSPVGSAPVASFLFGVGGILLEFAVRTNSG